MFFVKLLNISVRKASSMLSAAFFSLRCTTGILPGAYVVLHFVIAYYLLELLHKLYIINPNYIPNPNPNPKKCIVRFFFLSLEEC